ncbi:MAG: hypothetical protein JO040_15045 [Gemmatimonadetes bacterium]|nr:hypothetical protein [Gemmatimonadota bacterium]
MNPEPTDPPPTFSGSDAGTRIVEWLDAVLLDLREERISAAREALEGAGWRDGAAPGSVPPEILEATRRRIDLAAAALREPDPSPGDAEQALLMARSHFLPGG